LEMFLSQFSNPAWQVSITQVPPVHFGTAFA
jgi:hypothetical protein